MSVINSMQKARDKMKSNIKEEDLVTTINNIFANKGPTITIQELFQKAKMEIESERKDISIDDYYDAYNQAVENFITDIKDEITLCYGAVAKLQHVFGYPPLEYNEKTIEKLIPVEFYKDILKPKFLKDFVQNQALAKDDVLAKSLIAWWGNSIDTTRTINRQLTRNFVDMIDLWSGFLLQFKEKTLMANLKTDSSSHKKHVSTAKL